MDRSHYAVLAEGLRKRYGDELALDGLHLAVERGSVHGLLGPAGAGKTTALRILSTRSWPDGGRAWIAGRDVACRPREVREAIGLAGRDRAVIDDALTGRQNLVMFALLFQLDKSSALRRADELLERFALSELAGTRVVEWSAAARRRLELAAHMILTPQILLLDEPTAGLGPGSRDGVWEAMHSLAAEGMTILVATSSLEEAARFADRVAVVGNGRTIADSTPAELVRRVGGDRIEVVVREAADVPFAVRAVTRVTGDPPAADCENRRITAAVADRVSALNDVVRTLCHWGVGVDRLARRRPSLDEVFVGLTGRHAGERGPSPAGIGRPVGSGRSRSWCRIADGDAGWL